MFEIGDKIAHPGHGACILKGFCERTIQGETICFYDLAPSTEHSTSILVPIEHAKALGLRDIISSDEADKLLESLADIEPEWTRDHHKRYQESLEALKSTDLRDSAGVLKSLMIREPEVRLTNTDRDMLQKVQKKLLSEIALAKGISFDDILGNIEEAFKEEAEQEKQAV